MGLFLLAALTGLLGVREATVTDKGGGWTLRLTYASMSRPGLDTPWGVEIIHKGGFPADEVTLRTTAAYFDLFDENGFDPEATKVQQDPTWITWTLPAPPRGEDTLSVGFDARISPAKQRGASATTELLAPDGNVLARVNYRTRLMP